MWIKELQSLIKEDSDIRSNCGYAISIFNSVRNGIEDGTLIVKNINDLKKHITQAKNRLRGIK